MNKSYLDKGEDGWRGCALAWPDHRWRKRQAIKTDDFLQGSDCPLGARGEPHKSLLIKSGQFIDGLMSLGH